MTETRIPVILDTDIGSDIDDTWALAMLLKCPELDLKLVTSSTGDTEYRAKIVCKLLEIAGRTGVPVGVGIRQPMAESEKRQAPWVADYRLEDYPGEVLRDGVGALVETVMNSPEQPVIAAIGPLTNVAAALKRRPLIAQRARFVGMHGCLRRSYKIDGRVIAEYNVQRDPQACQRTFAAPWPKTITPLDTCGFVALKGEKYLRVAQSSEPLARAVIENYEIWNRSGGRVKEPDVSSILFDCVAVYLIYSDELLVMERLGLRVTDDGFTVPDATGPQVNCAVAWKDLGQFEDLIVERLTGQKRA